MTKEISAPGLKLLRLMLDRKYSKPTIDTVAGLCLLSENKTALAEELLEYLADETHTEREFARMLSDKIKETEL